MDSPVQFLRLFNHIFLSLHLTFKRRELNFLPSLEIDDNDYYVIVQFIWMAMI